MIFHGNVKIASVGLQIWVSSYSIAKLLLFFALFFLLGRFHAFEKAHQMDPKSAGRGVRQFKTYLLHRLEEVSFLVHEVSWSVVAALLNDETLMQFIYISCHYQ